MRAFGQTTGARAGVLLLCCSSAARAQISPGRLSRAHQDLDGPLKCGECHSFGAENPTLRCLHCHKEVAARLQLGRGYHSTIIPGGATEASCGKCHPEHGGVGFRLIDPGFTKNGFDHSKLGFALEGKHGLLKCNQCHQPKFIPSYMRADIRMNLNRTYLGLDTACISCHQDPHQSTLGPKCAGCHDFEHWKPASRFDHAQADFALTGRHQTVPCEKCHIPEPGKPLVVKLARIPYAECTACHKDPHGGAIQARCESCHSTVSWKQLNPGESFNHSRTKFALNGKHARLACSACHKTTDFSQPVAHGRCLDCHKDPHRGQFAARADGGDCGACHNEDSFLRSTFTVASHQKTGYPLKGKHATAACAKCHPGVKAERNYYPAHGNCAACHKDAHQGQFASTRWEGRCGDCHNEESFRPSLFTLALHNRTGFALSGAHVAVACRDCHVKAGTQTDGAWQFHFSNEACSSCHADPHGFRTDFAGRAVRRCDACHSVATWERTAPFNHDATKFPLRGAHRTAGCLECHKPRTQADGTRSIVFAAAPSPCRECHEDAHADSSAARGRTPIAGIATSRLDGSHPISTTRQLDSGWKAGIWVCPASCATSGVK